MRDVAPHIDLHEALLETRLRLIGRQEIAHALRTGFLRIVVVHATDRGTMAAFDTAIGGADRMIEHHDLRSTGLALDQRLDLGLVSAANLVLVVEVAHRGLVRGQDEGLTVERQVAGQPCIVDADLEVAVVALAARHARADRGIVGDRLDTEVGEIGNGGLDPGGERLHGGGRRSDLDRRHDGSSSLKVRSQAYAFRVPCLMKRPHGLSGKACLSAPRPARPCRSGPCRARCTGERRNSRRAPPPRRARPAGP